MAESQQQNSLAHLPITLFASVMGLSGLALVWRRAARVWGVPQWPFQVLLAAAVLAFLVVGAAYLTKWIRHPGAAKAELRHPIRMVFASTITIGLLLIATAAAELARPLASVLWWIGAIGHLIITVVLLSAWFTRTDIGLTAVTPAWFIPVVGNIVTPLAASELGSIDLAWFAFGAGIVLWLAFLPIVIFRLLFHEPGLPPKLVPTLAIFVPPPSVGLLSWVALGGRLDDPIGRILYAAAVVFAILVLAQLPRLIATPWALSWWAYTFPAAAIGVAATAVAGAFGGPVWTTVAVFFVALATVVVLGVTFLTLRAAARRQICLPEG